MPDAYPGLPETFQPAQFKPKRVPPPPKVAGTVNRITRDLKSGIIDAATAYGSDGHGTGGLPGYLFYLAGSHPKAFAGLLGKLLPLQVNSSTKSVVGQINIVSVPVDHYLSAEDVRKLAPEPPIVEHEPQGGIATDTPPDTDQS